MLVCTSLPNIIFHENVSGCFGYVSELIADELFEPDEEKGLYFVVNLSNFLVQANEDTFGTNILSDV